MTDINSEQATATTENESNDSPWAPRQTPTVAQPVAWPPSQPSAQQQVSSEDEPVAQSLDYDGYQPSAQQSIPFTGKHISLTIVIALITALIGAGLASFFMFGATEAVPQLEKQFERIASSEPRETLGIDTGTELSVNVAAKALPSVVSVAVTQEQMTLMGAMQAEGNGSGVIIREDGYILTNYHVIEGGTRIEVTAGTKTYEATVVGTDPSSDLAVLKVDARDLPAIDIGTSSDLKVGQYVMAVGNPFGLSESVSVGIISALGRTEAFRTGSMLAVYANLIQTDAAINPGNSGGALVDADGRLIGINTLIKTTSGSSAGVGFAIPVDTALDIANQLIEGGTASHPFLGVATQTVDSASSQQFRMPVDAGAYVVEVLVGSPADKAGLQKGDILVRIGERDINTSEDVFAAVRMYKEGDVVVVEYYRGDNLQKTEVTLGNDSDEVAVEGSRMPEEMVPNDASQSNPHEGIVPQELIDMLKRYGFSHSW